MVRIELKPNEPMKEALRRFKKMCNNEGIISRMRRRTFYEKPSARRRRAENARMKTIRKYERLREGAGA